MKHESPVIKILDDYELRLPLEEDAFQLARVIDKNRDYLKKWLPWLDASKTTQDSLLFIQKTHADWSLQRLFTGLIYRENIIVGAMGFHGKAHRYMPMGYWIAESAAGTGLCTAATRALVRWAFRYYDDLEMIELKAASDNLASRRVAEKVGFRCEAVLRRREWLYTRFVDHAVYSLTRAEFST